MVQEILPFVTIIIPTYNEERHIVRCLESIVTNDYPQDRIEVLVVDGLSTDQSRQIVKKFAGRYPFIQLLDNPKRSAPAALNVGLQAARGEIIIRMDAHTTYAYDYIRQCVFLLETTGAANVGGPQRAVGEGYVDKAIAIAVTTPFAAGNAYYRFSEQERWVDTVYLGAWRKNTLECLGGFNEDWVVNQDYELNYRLRKAGGKIFLSPKIKCWYHVRPTLTALARQYFRYGLWKVKTLVAYPTSLRWRQLAAPTLIAGLAVSLLVLPVKPFLALPVPLAYVAANFFFSLAVARRKGWLYFPILPFIYATLHFSWGLGFYIGIFRWGILGNTRVKTSG